MTYDTFLHSKIEVAPVSGFAVRAEEAKVEQPSLFEMLNAE